MWGKCGQCLTQPSSGSIREAIMYMPQSMVEAGSPKCRELSGTKEREPPLPPGEVKASFLEEVILELSLKE